MRAEQTLKTILGLGGEIAADGKHLFVDLPAQAWTKQIRDELKLNKEGLLELLRSGHGHPPTGCTSDTSLTRLCDGPGWAVVESGTLRGECVVWVRDESVRLPEGVKDLVCYTWAELEFLLDISPENLRHIHATKRLFGATVSGSESLRSSH